MAANPLNPKKRMVSKAFHRIMDTYGRQIFTGPPENVRDYVMAATRALMQGDWARAHALACGLNAWNLLPQKDMVRGSDGRVSMYDTWCCGGAYIACHASTRSPAQYTLVCAEKQSHRPRGSLDTSG